jgi:uncharacterized LabA/DUF88 family protein
VFQSLPGGWSNKNKKIFWKYKKYIPFLINKIQSLDGFYDKHIELTKTFFYEGKYNSKLITNFTWGCNQKISELNEMIKKEQKLLNFISQEKLSRDARRKINQHVEEVKEKLEIEKQKYYRNISKQKRHFHGQKNLFEILEAGSLINVKHTPLKQRKGEVYQKGVDVLLAVDMVSLAHTNAYDIAIVLTGDTDLIEAIKVVERLGKTVIVLSYYDSEDPQKSNISDLIGVGKFINIKDFTDEEIEKMSELRR